MATVLERPQARVGSANSLGHARKFCLPSVFGKGSEMSGLTPDEKKRLVDLAESLIQPPSLPAPGDPPIVYGYLRVPVDQLGRALRLEGVLAAFAGEHALQLGATFMDRTTSEDTFHRPGFTALLDVLRLPGTAGAVIPDWHHLSPDPDEVPTLVQAIARTGCRIFVAHDAQVWQPRDGLLPPQIADDEAATDRGEWRAERAERWRYRRLLWRLDD